MSKTKSIIRWAGGKVWLTDSISEYLPDKFENYHEPFLGGASIFLSLRQSGNLQKDVFLSDVNKELIETYQVIKNFPKELIDDLESYQNTKEYYYLVREQTPESAISRAARFLFLNRTSFNGIYRVNLKGKYNVPFGFRKMSYFFKPEDIFALSSSLQDVELTTVDFESTLLNIKKNDLVFLDPPYTVAHENNGFVKYNQKIFAWEDQERLRKYIDRLNEIEAYFILTNAAHHSITSLYDGIGEVKRLTRPSLIGGKGAKRNNYDEFLFTNK
jgi:DNA adenine methylase